MPAAWCAARRSTENSHAVLGLYPAPQRALVWRGLHPVQHRPGQHAEDPGAAGGAWKSDRSDLVGQRVFSRRINLPIGLLSFYLLAARPAFFQALEAQVALFVFFAACHFSQFAYNLPVLLRGGRVGVAYWPVLRGPMLRIFVIDATL